VSAKSPMPSVDARPLLSRYWDGILDAMTSI
jgi:hypothetical protein